MSGLVPYMLYYDGESTGQKQPVDTIVKVLY